MKKGTFPLIPFLYSFSAINLTPPPHSFRYFIKMDRKAELERKKAKLAMLREEKDRRRREKEQKDIEEAATRGGSAPSGENRRDLDEMLSSLGVAPVSEVLSSLSSVNSGTQDESAQQTPDGSLLQPATNGSAA